MPVMAGPLPDLLSAIVAFLQGTPAITSLLAGGFGQGGFGYGGFGGGENRIFTDFVPSGMVPPYIVIYGYREAEPGESVDDSQSDGVVCIVANDLDQAFTIGKTLKNYVDCPTMNHAAIPRAPFSFADGVEFSNRRDRPSAGRIPGLGMNGFYAYEYTLPYTFLIDPML